MWIVPDRAMWMQASGGDGDKDFIIRPPSSSPEPGVSYGGAENQKPDEEADDIGYQESQGIAKHVKEKLEQGDERHRLPTVEVPYDEEAIRLYIERTVDKVELSGKRLYYETDELDREVLSGPYYSGPYTYGEYKGQYKKAYWDNKNGVIVIRDPAGQYGGAAFVPTDPKLPGRKYLEFYFPRTWHDLEPLAE